MKTNRIFLGISMGLLMVLGSCSKMLDIPQNGSFSQEDFYQTDEDALAAVATIYNHWRSSYETRMTLLTTLSDEASKGGANINFFATWKERNSYIFNAGNEGIATYYKAAYEMVYYCNLIIENVAPDTPVKKQCVAEAKFFRAYTYFHLAALFGETVPVVDHLLSTEEYHVGRSEPGQLWTLVENDLKASLESLPSKASKTDKNTYRVTKEAAEVMLGKAYLWQKKYAEAASEFDKVVNSGLYGLWGVDEPGEYKMLLHAAANDCCEKVLDIRIPKDADNYDKNNLSNTTKWWGYFFWSSRMSKMTTAASNTYSTGEGYLPPRKELYDAFVAEEGVDGYRLNSTLKTVWQLADEGITVTADMPDHDLYFNWKNRGLKEDLMAVMSGRGSEHMTYTNMPVIRYAEVLLLAAEAQLLGGSPAKADQYVNQVRQRAKLGAKTGVTLQDIQTEKNLELCFEGVRYLDIIRWGIAYDLMKDQGKETYNLKVTKDGPNYTYERVVSDTNPNAGFKQGKNELLPIPKAEMDVNGVENGGKMTQNPGW
jgi:hypothetical protein